MKYSIEILENKVQGNTIDELLLQIDKLVGAVNYDSLVDRIKTSIQALGPELPIVETLGVENIVNKVKE